MLRKKLMQDLSLQKKKKMENNRSNFAMGLLLSTVMYTGWGLIAAVIYTSIAPEFGLPMVSLAALLGLWWLWFFVFVPPVVFLISSLTSSGALLSNKEQIAKNKESA